MEVQSDFTRELLKWNAESNNRVLPWKAVNDPYKIWLSEVILQQTQVSQGLAYYQKFVQKYPNVHSLAQATEEQVLSDWKGLGYNSRGRNLHKTAQVVASELKGKFPSSKQDLKKLPGIGNYIASAVASFAFGEDCAVLEANVYRVLSRFYRIETEIQTPKAEKEFQKLVDAHLPQSQSAIFNQAIMDFGAMVCKPKQPLCGECVMQNFCQSGKEMIAKEYPKKKKKAAKKQLFLYWFLPLYSNQIPLVRRQEKGFWSMLYTLPSVERESSVSEVMLQGKSIHLNTLEQLGVFKQEFTHRSVHISVFSFPQSFKVKADKWVEVKDCEKEAIPPILLEILKEIIILDKN